MTKNTQIEMAYRVPGKEWKRRTFKTQAALEKAVDKLVDTWGSHVEIHTRDAE